MSRWKKSSFALQEQFRDFMEGYEVEHRKMFGYPCCFLNGNMMTGLHEENWIVRLSEEDRNAYQQRYQVAPFEPMEGKVMREYLVIPEEVRKNPVDLAEWMDASWRYVASLPPKQPKPRKKKKSPALS